MQKIQLADNLYVYCLTGQSETNILVLANQGKALLIDTGYPEQAKELRKALEQDGLKAEIVINSHFHPDHINGNYIFADCKFMGIEFYKQNFELFEALNPNIPFVKPTTLLKHGQTMDYGSFALKFLSLPGHCRDLMAIVINDEIIHIADVMMFNNAGQHTIPYVSYDGTIDEHLQSLQTVKSFTYPVMLPSHGIILKDKTAIDEAVELRIHYLQRLKTLGKTAKLADCISLPLEKYTHLSLHDGNIKNIFR